MCITPEKWLCCGPGRGATAIIVDEPSTNTPKKAKTLEKKALEIDGGGAGILANGGKVNI
jgi:hypothetical protein